MKLNIVLHCGGMPFNGDTLDNASLGGSETAALYVAKQLAAQGHRVTLFTNHNEPSFSHGVNFQFAGYPSEACPLGHIFEQYATMTPHDVLIIQRHPGAFARQYNAKLTYWWLHDLALYRMKGMVQNQMWNITRTLTVSDYHKKQVAEVYGIEEDAIAVLPNGVDSDLYMDDLVKFNDGKKHLIYSSRPERGLENLVAPGGIMEQLGDEYVLHVCGYDNTTEQMRPMYEYLWSRCEELPNVINEGHLTKQQLANLQRTCFAWVYPTIFEEVFCITAAECMMAGIHIVTTDAGCLKETLGTYGKVVPLYSTGEVNIHRFVTAIRNLPDAKPATPSFKHTVEHSVEILEGIIADDFKRAAANPHTVARHLMNMSDIKAIVESPELNNAVFDELTECYGFYLRDDFEQHYARYYEYEKQRGVNYGPERLDGNDRFEVVSGQVSMLPEGATILDYGCAHGHYTINLAKRFPHLTFVGIDLCQSNVDKAEAWAKEENLHNISFRKTDDNLSALNVGDLFDFIIAAEVLEHVAEPQKLADRLATFLKDDGIFLMTTPYGPWEASGYKEHWPWRAHLHHFERADLVEAFGHHSGFNVMVVPASPNLGSYITIYCKPIEPSRDIDYARKLSQQSPQQTLSLCMIVKDAAKTILQSLDSVKGIVDEIIVGIDCNTKDDTKALIEGWAEDNHIDPTKVVLFEIDSPLETGFDEARNRTIEWATCDWILWMDADEVIYFHENIKKYLKHNQYNGYAINQHHVAVEPLGVIKTDFPCRIFRNHQSATNGDQKAIKFFGVVHEHPETDINEGVGAVTIIPDVHIMHNGYATEYIRRKRFERNIGLMARDREKYPARKLGKFLWMRDLSLLCQYEMEHNGNQITPSVIDKARNGVEIWEELAKDGDTRLVIDGLDFYSRCSALLGGGFEFTTAIEASKIPGGLNMNSAVSVSGNFQSRKHVDLLVGLIINSKTDGYDSRYF